MMMQNLFSTRQFNTLLVVTLLGTTVVQAQQRFSAGPRVGVNLSDFVGGPVSTKPIVGLTAGGFIMYSSLSHFGISADLMYSQKGADVQTPYRHRINYLEIPIALRYFLTRSGKFRPNVFFGPALGFRLDGREINKTTNTKRNMSAEINAVDLGLTAGFQLNFKGAGRRQRFLIDGRYTYGLPETYTQTNIDRHNSVFTLTLGYGFGVGLEYRSTRRRQPIR